MEPQQLILSRKDPGREPGPSCLNVVSSSVLESHPADVRPGQGGSQELHLGWQGRTRARQSQMGYVGALDRPKGPGNHRPKDIIKGPVGQVAGQRTRPGQRTMEGVGHAQSRPD